MIIGYLILLFLIISIINDYSNIRGFFGQKICHILIIIFLYFLHRRSFTTFISLFRDFDTYFNRFYVICGVIPPFITFTIFLISVLVNIIITVLLFGLIMRNEIFRGIIVKLLPISIIIEVYLDFFYLYQQKKIESNTILLVFIILCVLTEIGVYFLYKSNFMKAFFQAPKRKPNSIMPKEE